MQNRSIITEKHTKAAIVPNFPICTAKMCNFACNTDSSDSSSDEAGAAGAVGLTG
jgi:hypothetical protein